MPRLMPRWVRKALTVPAHNPDFPLTDAEAEAEMLRMRAEPKPLARPVVVIAGYRGWWIISASVARSLSRLTGAPPERFLPLAYPFRTDVGAIARDVVARVDAKWPSGERTRTVEVDYVGVSMGGLIGRLCASGLMGGKPLAVRRMFTLGTPHRGAVLAERIAPDRAARDMLPRSALLKRLDDAWPSRGYELVPYARLRDGFVGATRTAPPGTEPLWVSGLREKYLSHVTISEDERILVDIARRLRGEQPVALRGSRPPMD